MPVDRGGPLLAAAMVGDAFLEGLAFVQYFRESPWPHALVLFAAPQVARGSDAPMGIAVAAHGGREGDSRTGHRVGSGCRSCLRSAAAGGKKGQGDQDPRFEMEHAVVRIAAVE